MWASAEDDISSILDEFVRLGGMAAMEGRMDLGLGPVDSSAVWSTCWGTVSRSCPARQRVHGLRSSFQWSPSNARRLLAHQP